MSRRLSPDFAPSRQSDLEAPAKNRSAVTVSATFAGAEPDVESGAGARHLAICKRLLSSDRSPAIKPFLACNVLVAFYGPSGGSYWTFAAERTD